MNHLFKLAALGVLITGAMLVPDAKADEWDRKTIVTINQPMDVQGTVLIPGKYVMKLADSESDRHIVQIYNADETHLISTVLTVPASRMTSSDTNFTFYETTPGQPMVLRTWYFADSQDGETFALPPDPRHR
jgi:hypothetical protein